MASEHEESVRVVQGHLDRQEWDEAIAELIKLTERLPKNLKLQLRLAHLYWKVGDTEKALERFQFCATGFCTRSNYKEALGAATSILKLQPDSQFALEMLRNIEAEPDFVGKGVADSLKENLLVSLPPEALEELAGCLQLSVYPEGATVVEEGDAGLHFFLIRCGEVQVFLTDREGKRFPLAVFQEGDFFGEISLLTGGPRTATALATKPTELWILAKPDFDRLIARYRRFKEVIDQYGQERAKQSVRQTHARGVERQFFPRIPVELRVEATMLDEAGNPLAMRALAGVLEDISLGGARLRVPVSHPQQLDQLRKVRQVRVSPEPGLSLTCFLQCVEQNRIGRHSYADLSLTFGELSADQKEQINELITRELLS